MSKPADTWMPLYIGDYLADTMHLTHAQHGIYLLLIMAYWRNGGPLPDDAAQLAAIAKCSPAEWRRHQAVIKSFFHVEDGNWAHKRIDAEIDHALAINEQRRNAGKASAQARWGRKPNGEDNENLTSVVTGAITKAPRKNTPSPSPSPSSSLRSEEEDSEELRSSGAARAPPLPYDGVKNLWDKGLSILGPKQRSLLGKLRKSHGDPAVLAAIVDCETENPSDPPAFLIACCQRRHDNDRSSPPSKTSISVLREPQTPSTGASARPLAALIATLVSHYWTAADPPASREAQIADWIEDLHEFPYHDIAAACREWRRAHTKRPTIAEIRNLCREAHQQPRPAPTDMDAYARSVGFTSNAERMLAIAADRQKRANTEARLRTLGENHVAA